MTEFLISFVAFIGSIAIGILLIAVIANIHGLIKEKVVGTIFEKIVSIIEYAFLFLLFIIFLLAGTMTLYEIIYL